MESSDTSDSEIAGGVIAAGAQLADPAAFLRRACADLGAALRLCLPLFAMQLRASRRRSVFGLMWMVMPIAASLALALVLQARHLAPTQDLAIPYAAFATTGIVMWQGFADGLTLPLQQFTANRVAILQMGMPLETPVLVAALEIALSALIRLVLLALVLAGLGVAPGASLAALPLVLAGLVALGLAIGMVLAPFGMLVEDVGRGLPLLVLVWMLASPVFYPAPALAALALNPLAPLIEGGRAALTGGHAGAAALIVALAALALLAPAWLAMRLSRPHLVEPLA